MNKHRHKSIYISNSFSHSPSQTYGFSPNKNTTEEIPQKARKVTQTKTETRRHWADPPAYKHSHVRHLVTIRLSRTTRQALIWNTRFRWSVPTSSCSNWSDRTTESDSGSGPLLLGSIITVLYPPIYYVFMVVYLLPVFRETGLYWTATSHQRKQR